MRRDTSSRIATLVWASLIIAAAAADAGAQQLSPADVAAKLSGTWTLNLELSHGFGPTGRNPARRGRGVQPSFAVAPRVPQGRGGGGGGAAGGGSASDLTPAERAALAAMRQLQQIAAVITIAATADTVTFTDARGERTYAIDDKTVKIDVGGAPVSTKSKWDKGILRQEFSIPQSKLIQTWGLDEIGHLVLTAKVESMTLQTPDQKAVFDRK